MDWRINPMTTAAVTSMPTPTRARAMQKSTTNPKLEKARAAMEFEQLERQRKVQASKAPRLSAQHKGVLFLLLGLALFMAAANFTVSFSGLFGAAAWALGDKTPWLQAAAPVMYDVAIIAFTIKLFMDREEQLNTRWTWLWIGVLASISSTANIFHTLSVSTAANLPQFIVGCVISGSAPFLLALVIDVAASKVFVRPGGHQ